MVRKQKALINQKPACEICTVFSLRWISAQIIHAGLKIPPQKCKSRLHNRANEQMCQKQNNQRKTRKTEVVANKKD